MRKLLDSGHFYNQVRERLKIESLVVVAKQHIQDWILSGEFQPGQQIKEEEIAKRLAISRPPVREALMLL
ncbi:MAG: GntR family transcriptional regulator [Deltaproteobacteria bacterium]|nr:GntR family transcriptional regulator [Deltaproteobacteria bacterium]